MKGLQTLEALPVPGPNTMGGSSTDCKVPGPRAAREGRHLLVYWLVVSLESNR